MDINNFLEMAAMFIVALCLIMIGYHFGKIEKKNKTKLDAISGWESPFVTAVASCDTTSLENNSGSENAMMFGKITNENTIVEAIKPFIRHTVIDEQPYRKVVVSKLDIKDRRN